MKKFVNMFVCIICSLLLSSVLIAQTGDSESNKKDDSSKKKETKIEKKTSDGHDTMSVNTKSGKYLKMIPSIKDLFFQMYFDNSLFYFINGDLRAIDEASLDTVEDTDDEVLVGYYRIGAKFKARLYKDIMFYFDAYKVGFWGNDSSEYQQKYNSFYLKKAFMVLPIIKTNSMHLLASVGRQRYKLAGDYSADINVEAKEFSKVNYYRTTFHKNYLMYDVIDALVIQWKLKKMGIGFDAFVDLFSMNSPSDDIYMLKSDRHEYTVNNFEGNVNIFRYAFAPFYDKEKKSGLLNKLFIKPAIIYATIGGLGYGSNESGGYEESNGGSSSNEADEDWILNGSLSFYVKLLKKLTVLGEFGYSTGKDNKNDAMQDDIEFSGAMAHLSTTFHVIDWLMLGGSFLYVEGAETNDQGEYTNYGYIGMKGTKMGGFLFSKYYGSYPFGVLDYWGIWFDPFIAIRRTPTNAASFRLAVENLNLSSFKRNDKNGLSVAIDVWVYWDPSVTSADFNDSSLPSHIQDQQRWQDSEGTPGEMMGMEYNLWFAYTCYDGLLEIGAQAGMFIPDSYFKNRVSDRAAPGGEDTFYGAEIYTKFKF